MPIDHSYVQVAVDGSGKKVANVQQTDPDGDVVQLQKTVVADPETATDDGLQRVDNGAARTGSLDGGHATIGVTTDAEATGNGSLVAILKRLRTLLAGGLPAALSNGRLKAEQTAAVVEATGTLDAAEETVELSVQGHPGAAFEISGDMDGVLAFEVRVAAGLGWQPQTVYSYYDADFVSYASAGGEQFNYGYFYGAGGYDAIRVRCTVRNSGSSVVVLRTSSNHPVQPIVALRDIPTRHVQGSQLDGHSQTLGWTTDAEATGNGTVVGVLKRLRTLLAGGLPAALGAAGGLKVDGSGTALPVSGTFWQATQPVSGTVTANSPAAATATLSNVNDTASSTTLLAANSARIGATIHNDSTVALYVKFGATASTTSFTVKMAADAYYEVPFGFTGRIDGIWASDAAGAARITEITA